MLVLNMSPTYFAPVRIKLLDAEGALQEHRFDAQFERWNMDQIKAYFESTTQRSDADVARSALKGWRHIGRPGGVAFEFNDANLEELLQVPGMATALVEALIQSWRPTEGTQTTPSTPSALEAAAEKN